jgi:hypothetical protein
VAVVGVDLHNNRTQTALKEKQYTQQYKNNKKTQNTQNIKHKSSNLENKEKEEVIVGQRTALNLRTASYQ